MRNAVIIACVLVLAACSKVAGEAETVAAHETAAPAPQAVAADGAGHAHADFAGEWIGPEGLFVEVTPTQAGEYKLAIAGDLDAPPEGVQTTGRDVPAGIEFVRDGKTLLLRRAKGDETGLTALEGKTDCLMVQSGEGFCRKGDAR